MATSSSSPHATPSEGSLGSNADDGTSSAARRGELSGQASEFLGGVVQGTHRAIDRAAEGAAPHIQRLQEGLALASDTLHQRADQVRELGDEWSESLRGTVRDHPLAALATAVVAGILIARLTQR